MNYHCYTPFEGERCPVCGSGQVREIREDDECLVLEGGTIETGMLCEVLQQEGIPCYRQSQIGAAMAVLIAIAIGTFYGFSLPRRAKAPAPPVDPS